MHNALDTQEICICINSRLVKNKSKNKSAECQRWPSTRRSSTQREITRTSEMVIHTEYHLSQYYYCLFIFLYISKCCWSFWLSMEKSWAERGQPPFAENPNLSDASFFFHSRLCFADTEQTRLYSKMIYSF